MRQVIIRSNSQEYIHEVNVKNLITAFKLALKNMPFEKGSRIDSITFSGFEKSEITKLVGHKIW